jgi:hypothetical protein
VNNSKLSLLLDDRPSQKDFLDFHAYCQTLRDLLLHSGTTTPLTIGIFGRWGTGKTTLMRMLENTLKSEGVVSVWFNAWQYGKEEELWAAFLQSILNKLKADLRQLERLKFNTNLLWNRIDWDNALENALKYTLRILIVIIPIAITWPLSRRIQQEAYNAILRILGGTLSVGLGFWVFVKPLAEAIRKNINLDISTFWKTSNYQKHIAFLDEFREHFADIVQSLPSKEEKRLVVFIDDLDRCSPDKTLQILDAIKLFVDIQGCVYILGLDQDIVQKAVSIKYKDDPIAQADYLGKIIQLPFQLPPLDRNRMQEFMDQLKLELPDRRCHQVFVEGLIANPRELKRTVNIFSLLWNLAANRQKLAELIKPVRLAKIVVIQHSYPELHKLLRSHAHLLIELEVYFRKDETKSAPGELTVKRWSPSTLVELREALLRHFNLDELRILCFDLGVDFEDIAGDTFASKTTELVVYFQRRGLLHKLVERVRESRPDIEWHEPPGGIIDTNEPNSSNDLSPSLSSDLEPFANNAALRRILLLHELKIGQEDDANFANLEAEAIEVYFTLTRRAETPEILNVKGAQTRSSYSHPSSKVTSQNNVF